MRLAVAAIFPSFTARFEGRVPYLYRDVKGFVTCGVGNLVDPIAAAMNLPWCHGGDVTNPADDAAIVAGWEAVKALPPAMIASAYASATDLRLTEAAIDQLVRSRAEEMDVVLASRFANWATLPADAQLAVLSIAWACGPWFDFPRLQAALAGTDFATCANESAIAAAGNPGIVPRNAANRALFVAAGLVVSQGLDPSILHGTA